MSRNSELVDYTDTYAAIDEELRETKRQDALQNKDALLELPALQGFLQTEFAGSDAERYSGTVGISLGNQHLMGGGMDQMDGFKRMERCRIALDALDRCGWKRSYFQRKFHDAFLNSCARIFFKLDGPGAFNRAYQRILEINNWDDLAQEILISTPRRFGKTISVSLFSAALVYSCAGVELSIYSTCKRISAKLLRNVVKFFRLIEQTLGGDPMKILRSNGEEIHVQGPEGIQDVRIVNSYPSRVRTLPLLPLQHTQNIQAHSLSLSPQVKIVKSQHLE